GCDNNNSNSNHNNNNSNNNNNNNNNNNSNNNNNHNNNNNNNNNNSNNSNNSHCSPAAPQVSAAPAGSSLVFPERGLWTREYTLSLRLVDALTLRRLLSDSSFRTNMAASATEPPITTPTGIFHWSGSGPRPGPRSGAEPVTLGVACTGHPGWADQDQDQKQKQIQSEDAVFLPLEQQLKRAGSRRPRYNNNNMTAAGGHSLGRQANSVLHKRK
ncbi:hypothetical protein INR49_010298, partial [Caranx melampygus]